MPAEQLAAKNIQDLVARRLIVPQPPDFFHLAKSRSDFKGISVLGIRVNAGALDRFRNLAQRQVGFHERGHFESWQFTGGRLLFPISEILQDVTGHLQGIGRGLYLDAIAFGPQQAGYNVNPVPEILRGVQGVAEPVRIHCTLHPGGVPGIARRIRVHVNLFAAAPKQPLRFFLLKDRNGSIRDQGAKHEFGRAKIALIDQSLRIPAPNRGTREALLN